MNLKFGRGSPLILFPPGIFDAYALTLAMYYNTIITITYNNIIIINCVLSNLKKVTVYKFYFYFCGDRKIIMIDL